MNDDYDARESMRLSDVSEFRRMDERDARRRNHWCELCDGRPNCPENEDEEPEDGE